MRATAIPLILNRGLGANKELNGMQTSKYWADVFLQPGIEKTSDSLELVNQELRASNGSVALNSERQQT